jgi:hypothetical protein
LTIFATPASFSTLGVLAASTASSYPLAAAATRSGGHPAPAAASIRETSCPACNAAPAAYDSHIG